MRIHIALDDDLLDGLDRQCGKRQRSASIAELIRRGLEDEQRWADDPAAWVCVVSIEEIWRGVAPTRSRR